MPSRFVALREASFWLLVEVDPEGVAGPSFFAGGIGLILLRLFALGGLAFKIGLILAGFFVGVLVLLVVAGELP